MGFSGRKGILAAETKSAAAARERERERERKWLYLREGAVEACWGCWKAEWLLSADVGDDCVKRSDRQVQLWDRHG
jgi:hypothetical protein